MIAEVIVMKFGGTSVGDAASIRQVVRIVRAELGRRPVVVVSAHAGVTDALCTLAASAPAGLADSEPIAAMHRSILGELGLPTTLLDPLLAELQDLARGLRLVGAVSPRALDLMLSYGERLSARTVAAALQQEGVAAAAVDAFAAGLRTDSAFGRARPLDDDGRIARSLTAVAGVPVVTGFLAADEQGNVTTLGRNGSDYSAALFGAALRVEEIQIWKDVDGVRTADPRLVPQAQPIRHMGYSELCELSSFGSKVLHPAAMWPAMESRIPLAVRNTREPAAPGTVIAEDTRGERPTVRAIAHRAGVALVTVASRRLVPQHAFLARVFHELDELGAEIATVAVSAAAVAVTVAAASAAAVAESLHPLGEVLVAPDQAVIGVVGDARGLERGGAAAVLQALSEQGIGVSCVGQGARGGTLAVVVPMAELRRTALCLHERFFPFGVPG